MANLADEQLKQLVEAAIFISPEPVSAERLMETVLAEFTVSRAKLKQTIAELTLDYSARGVQLVEVASGFRFQSMDSLSPWLSRLWQENAPRYSRAMLETLSLIAYRQPITRGEIEEVRGVAVSSHIIKTLNEREWIRVVGQKEVPGRPALYGTTRQFLDYFGLKSLSELPPMEDIEALAAQVEQDQQASQQALENESVSTAADADVDASPRSLKDGDTELSKAAVETDIQDDNE